MHAAASIPQQTRSTWVNAAIWLAAFLSPSVYFSLLLMANRLQISAPQSLVAPLFFLVPIVALVICEWVVWTASITAVRKVAWMLFTLLAMLLQFGILLVVLRAILIAVTGYAQ